MALKDLDQLWTAIHAFRKEGVTIVKDTKVSFGQTNYSHAKLEDILEEIDPFLDKHGIFITHFPGTTDHGEPALIMLVRHLPSEQQFETLMVLPLTKRDPQAAGSAITYYRRYSIGALLKLHLVDDDDARKATFDDPAPTQKKKPTGLVSEKVIQEIKKEIEPLDKDGKALLTEWLKQNGLWDGEWLVKDGDLEKIYEKISILKEPI